MAHSGKQVTATGDVTTGSTVLWGIAGAITTAGTLTLRDDGSGGTVKATVDVAAGNFSFLIPFGMSFPNGLHVTFTTAVGAVTFWL